MLHIFLRAFDVELLCLAEKLNIPIKEVAVNWQEIEGNYEILFTLAISMQQIKCR